MADDKPTPFVVNGKEYPVPEEFTLGEMCDAEQFFGVQFGVDQGSHMRLVAATLYVAIKRVDPTITVDDIRALPPEALQQAEAKADPTPALPPDEKPTVSSETSGGGSKNGGVDPDSIPTATGPPSLGTPAA